MADSPKASAEIINIPAPPPLLYSIEAERGLLGAILMNNNAWDQVNEPLAPEHFGDSFHSRIYEITQRIIEKGEAANPAIISVYLHKEESEKSHDEIRQYLFSLTKEALLPTPVSHYARLIYDLAIRRNLLGIAQQTIASLGEAPNPDVSALNVVENLEQNLYELTKGNASGTNLVPMNRVMTDAITNFKNVRESGSHTSGIPSGFNDLDTILGGLHPSDLIILAARPSMGKTAFALNVAWNVSQKFKAADVKKSVALFSLEMSSEQLAVRILSSKSGVSGIFIKQGNISKDEHKKVLAAGEEIQSAPIHIDDTPSLSIAALRSRARRLARKHNLGLIVVDYLQLLMPSGNRRLDNRVLEVSEITRTLKSIAKELGVPVLALSQLSRRVEERDDKMPQLADLRESGSIEQDADIVIFIYREAYYLEKSEPNKDNEEKFEKWKERYDEVKNQARLIVAKHRNGPTGKVDLHFTPSLAFFGNLAKYDD